MAEPAPPLDPRLVAVLRIAERCKYTGGQYVCMGHFDYWSDTMFWTRHLAGGILKYRVVPYDHPAPETIPEVTLVSAP